jgi:hypothetical protein
MIVPLMDNNQIGAVQGYIQIEGVGVVPYAVQAFVSTPKLPYGILSMFGQ